VTEIEPVPHEPERALVASPDVHSLLQLAVEKDLDVEKLGKLIDLQHKMEERQARREFAAALAAFQAECPPIPRTAVGGDTSRGGGGFAFKYAPLDAIEATVRPFLKKHGFSFRFEAEFTERTIRSTCVLTHAGGHSERSLFEIPLVAASRGMNTQQASGAADSYARRYALINALGLVSCDPDTDGGDESSEVVTPEQVEILEDLIDKRPPGSRARLLEWTKAQWGASTMEEIPASRFEWLKADLEAKIAKSGA
jgi:hypothetical protein